jgi:predicted DNA-binding protein with PD1-like motif
MDYFENNKLGRIFALRLDKGDDILGSVNNLIQKENIQDGVVVSGIGTIDNCVLHFVTHTDDASKMYFKQWKDTPLEVASIQGIIANSKPHLHAVVSNHEESWGGHLEPGCRTLYLCEIMIIETPNFKLTREPKVSDVNDNNHLIMNLVKKTSC